MMSACSCVTMADMLKMRDVSVKSPSGSDVSALKDTSLHVSE